MKYNQIVLAIVMLLLLSACQNTQASTNAQVSVDMESANQTSVSITENIAQEPNLEMQEADNGQSTNDIGPLSPEDALEYMKTTENLVIIDTATAREYEERHFEGAINIHYTEMPDRYGEIPEGSTVLLHCRLGMVVPRAYDVLLEYRPDLAEISYIDGAPLFDTYNDWVGGRHQLLGGLDPQEALEYMKANENLVIIEVTAPQYYGEQRFDGGIRIPYTEMDVRYNEIPENRPVLLHCGAGVVAPRAYDILKEKRPDIPQLSYIAGGPLFDEYNNWKENEIN